MGVHALPGILHLWWCSTYPGYSLGKVLHVGDPSWMTNRGIFFSTPMHLYVNAHGIVLRHGLLGRHCPGSRAGIPWSAANPVHQEGHSRVLAKPLCFLLVRLRVRFCFLVPQTQQCLKKGTLSSLFTFKSVLTVWLTKEGCFKVCAENPSCCSLCSAESGWERERHIKAWAQSRFRALTLIFLALVGLS